MTTVLLTGGSGFIGGHLAESLVRRGDTVRCLVRRSSRTERLQSLGIELIYGELDDLESLHGAWAGVDLVYHLAARTSAASTSELMRTNAGGVARMARACARQTTPPRLVLVSSVAAGGPIPRGKLRDESDPSHPISNYGRSKRAGEILASRWARAVPITVVRPGIVFGPRDYELLPMFAGLLRTRVHIVATWDAPPLSLIHVADLVEILLRAGDRGERLDPSHWEAPANGTGFYNACAAEYPNYSAFGRLVADALGLRRFVTLPLFDPLPWLVGGSVQLIARLRRRPSMVSVDKIRDATASSWACSTARIETSLGFVPPKPLATRFDETGAWYREQNWL